MTPNSQVLLVDILTFWLRPGKWQKKTSSKFNGETF